jgi:hypothetical protein
VLRARPQSQPVRVTTTTPRIPGADARFIPPPPAVSAPAPIIVKAHADAVPAPIAVKEPAIPIIVQGAEPKVQDKAQTPVPVTETVRQPVAESPQLGVVPSAAVVPIQIESTTNKSKLALRTQLQAQVSNLETVGRFLGGRSVRLGVLVEESLNVVLAESTPIPFRTMFWNLDGCRFSQNRIAISRHGILSGRLSTNFTCDLMLGATCVIHFNPNLGPSNFTTTVNAGDEMTLIPTNWNAKQIPSIMFVLEFQARPPNPLDGRVTNVAVQAPSAPPAVAERVRRPKPPKLA